MKYLFLFLLTLTLTITTGCKSGGGSCSGSSCSNNGTGSNPASSALSLSFLDTHFFDGNSNTWQTLGAVYVNSGNLGVIPLYSNIISTPLTTAMAQIALAETQYAAGVPSDPTTVSSIPYIKILASDSKATYNFQYKRFDSNNNIQAQMQGTATVVNGYALIPFVNEQFGNQMYVTNLSSSGSSSFTHQISIFASSSNSTPSPVKVINFQINPIIPLKNMSIAFSSDATNFNLSNRWNYYFNTTDYTPNHNFKLADLVDASTTADSIPYDVRFVFQTPPVLKITEVVFVEETLDSLLYKTTGVINFNRGINYFTQSINLDSNNHFLSKFSINNNVVSLSGNTTAEYRNISAGTKWALGFIYDFGTNPAFSANQNLLTPLKPMCQIINKQVYSPISDSTLKNSVTAAGGFYASCHPDTNSVLNLSSSQLAANNLQLNDTFYGFFSYRKAQPILNSSSLLEYDAGHFYGIKTVTFSVSGCVSIYEREASDLSTNPNTWVQKNIATADCGSNGFTSFTITKTDDILNHLNNYVTKADLSQVISGLGSSSPISRSDWNFNGSNFYNVIY